MKLRVPPWTRRLLSPADLWEIARAEPDYIRVSLRREDRWADGWRCTLYDPESEPCAEGRYARSPMEAFRAACSRIEVLPVPEFAEWRGCQIEVVA